MEFNASWAADICGVPKSKIERAARSGRLPNAYKHGTGAFAPWIVSLADLEAAGFKPNPNKLQQARKSQQKRGLGVQNQGQAE